MRKWMEMTVWAAASLALIAGALVCGRVLAQRENVAHSVLRLHVVANSDSAPDQAVKLRVRDRVLADCGYLFSGCSTAAEAAARAEKCAGLLRRSAQAALREEGLLYPVAVQTAPTRFPSKWYGKIRLPAGWYTAVNIRIGAAAGRNWWCVLYPPLCLTQDAVEADSETLTRLRESLSPEEFALVTQPDRLQIRMKFKLAELLSSLQK